MGNELLSKEWIAGFFDGEGCISLLKRKSKSRLYQLSIEIGNVDKNVLILIASIYGGKVRKHLSGVYAWGITGRDLQIRFLTDIEPYLMIKNSQAKMALVYLNTILDVKETYFKKGHAWNKTSNLIPDDTLAIRENCFKELKSEKNRLSTKNRIKDLV